MDMCMGVCGEACVAHTYIDMCKDMCVDICIHRCAISMRIHRSQIFGRGHVVCGCDIMATHNYMGHNYKGRNCVGHRFIGHKYMGHNYIGCDVMAHSCSKRAPGGCGNMRRRAARS